jgi:tetratricopeptide (TPR) repeat protein
MRTHVSMLIVLAALLAASVTLFAPARARAAGDDEGESTDLSELEARRLDKIIETIAVLRAKGDVAGMMELYGKGLALAPSDLSARERYTDLGIALFGYALTHKADPAKVVELLDQFDQFVGDEFDPISLLWWLRAVALRRLDRTDEADALRQKALDLNPDDTDYHHRVGYRLLMADLYEEAIAEFQTALAAADDDWDRGVCTWAIAASNLKVEHYEEAADQYEKAVELFKASRQPRNYDTLLEDASWAMYHLGRYYELRGRYKDAIAANERALKLLPEQLDETLGQIAAQNVAAIGDEYLKLGDAKKAVEQLERARELAPDAAGVYSSLGDAYTALGDGCEALYRELLERRPGYPMVYNNLAWFYVTHDMKLDEALKLSRTSIELAPDTDAYLDTLAEIYFRMGDTDKALEWINKVFALDPKPRHLIYFEQQRDKFEKAQKEAH